MKAPGIAYAAMAAILTLCGCGIQNPAAKLIVSDSPPQAAELVVWLRDVPPVAGVQVFIQHPPGTVMQSIQPVGPFTTVLLSSDNGVRTDYAAGIPVPVPFGYVRPQGGFPVCVISYDLPQCPPTWSFTTGPNGAPIRIADEFGNEVPNSVSHIDIVPSCSDSVPMPENG